MPELCENASVCYINKDYRIVRLKGNKCSLFLKNKQNQLLATLEGCNNELTEILLSDNTAELSDLEKRYLLSFIRAKKMAISKEVAARLDVSIIKYTDGREEYLAERQLKRKIDEGIDFAKVFINCLTASSLKIPADSKECSYHFGNASVAKLVVEENCNVNIDLRDNAFIESVVIGEKFSGALNLSRTAVESLFIGNNCRCNLTITDSKRCLNIQIADIFSGNITVANSCLYNFEVGYYSYADFMFSNNIVKKEIVIGDSFRGNFYATGQSVDIMKIGDDCKGHIRLSNQENSSGLQKLVLGEEFSGVLNLAGDESIKIIEFGRKNSGKTDASFAGALETVKIGKFYNGTTDLSGSNVKNIQVAYGASGSLNLKECNNLKRVLATINNSLRLESNERAKEQIIGGDVYYRFEEAAKADDNLPIYKKLYNTTRRLLSDRFI